jgi:hypothetical protein
MNCRESPLRYLLLVFLCLTLSGCGSEEATSEATSIGSPEEAPSCESLEPLVLQDPLTGGEFHCLWCNREWEWTVGGNHPRVFILIHMVCADLDSEAYAAIKDPKGSVLWRQQVKQGQRETTCVVHDNPPRGTYSVGLYGHANLLPTRRLIREFRGSLYLKIFDHRGDLILPSLG